MPAEIAGFRLQRDVLSIFVADDATPSNPIEFCGTGFLLRPNILVTCWHNVRDDPPEGCKYVAARETPSGGYSVSDMPNLAQDEGGADLALSNVHFEPELPFDLASVPTDVGTKVWSFGYPLTDVAAHPEIGLQFTLNARYLEGYITRAFYFPQPGPEGIPSYELDMPAPAGLSGAPLMRHGSKEIIGVIFGTNDVGQIEQFASVNPETGESEPEVQRIVTFGLALHTGVVRTARGPATGSVELGTYLDRLAPEE